MSRRHRLNGFAYNIAQQFATSAEHYAWLALSHGEPNVTIDLLSLAITPIIFDNERNRILAGRCGSALLGIADLMKPVEIRAAVLTASFDISNVTAEKDIIYVGTTQYRVILTDERDKEWTGEIARDRQFVYG